MRAEQLQRLHVRSFTLESSSARPRIGAPFDVTLTIRVDENVSAIDNVYLPAFFGPEEIGDERQTSSGRAGTTYRETLRLVAHAHGPVLIGSAYLDAIDARDGKPKRFVSNDLHLNVAGPALQLSNDSLRPAAWALAAAAAIIAVLLLARPAPRSTGIRPPAAPARVHEAASGFDTRSAIAQLRARRDRSSIMRLRSALWRDAGAAPGQTLDDVLGSVQAADAGLKELLRAVERAAFMPEPRLSAAVDDVLSRHHERFE